MDVKVAVPWGCHTCISIAPHDIAGLTSYIRETVKDLFSIITKFLILINGRMRAGHDVRKVYNEIS